MIRIISKNKKTGKKVVLKTPYNKVLISKNSITLINNDTFKMNLNSLKQLEKTIDV